MGVYVYSECLKQKEHPLKGFVSFSIQLFCEEAAEQPRFVGNVAAAEAEPLSSELRLTHSLLI